MRLPEIAIEELDIRRQREGRGNARATAAPERCCGLGERQGRAGVAEGVETLRLASWICLIRSVSHASVSARSQGARRSQSWKLVRLTSRARHIKATGLTVFSAAMNENTSLNARRFSLAKKTAAIFLGSRATISGQPSRAPS
jgi:hypothetical protein